VIAPFVQNARRLLASGDYAEALEMSANLSTLLDGSTATLSELEMAGARRWVLLLEGEALLGLGAWEEAIGPLVRAADAARRLDEKDLGSVLIALGRACHHTGRYEQAQAVLDEVLSHSSPAPLERAAALRLLGDMALRRGELELAEEHWNAALETAQRAGSSDAVGRAYRGLANCTALRGHYPESLDQLLEALQQLRRSEGGGDVPVLGAVLSRIVELENVLGRYGAAMVHGAELTDLTKDGRLPAQHAEALALVAETLAAVGLEAEARRSAGEAARTARDLGLRGTDASLRAARVLCDIGRAADALAVLDTVTEPPPSIVDDPTAQILAVRARALARTDATLSRELANAALSRPAPLLAIRAARIRLDAALALHDSGADAGARNAAKRGLKVLQGSGNKGLKLELLVAMYLAAPNHRVVEAAARTAMRVLEELPEHAVASFKQRRVIGEALNRWAREAQV
jgi:tetratricopeptide (TPR) repeat protein